MARRLTNLQVEGNLAQVNLAGIRFLLQATVTGGGAASDNTYTVTHARARRVIVYVDHATNICRVNYNAVATVNHLPLINQRYVVVDAKTGDVIHFFDTTGATPVRFVETD